MTDNEEKLSEPATCMINSVIELIYMHLGDMKCSTYKIQSLFFKKPCGYHEKKKYCDYFYIYLLFELLLKTNKKYI